MDKKTLAALRGSIKKWDLISKGKGRDLGTGNCPLCKLFVHRACIGCPVFTATKAIYCKYTPYAFWDKLVSENDDPSRAKTQQQKAAARSMLEFLKALLP